MYIFDCLHEEFFFVKSHDMIVNNVGRILTQFVKDPLRSEVPRAVRECQMAGICVRMVTGDSIHIFFHFTLFEKQTISFNSMFVGWWLVC